MTKVEMKADMRLLLKKLQKSAMHEIDYIYKIGEEDPGINLVILCRITQAMFDEMIFVGQQLLIEEIKRKSKSKSRKKIPRTKP